jgi:glucose/mannose-6-phosphate isomerase
MTTLDDLNLIQQRDPGQMLARIGELPQQCRDAWANVQAFRLPDGYDDSTAVVVAGLGGSAIGGDLVRTLVEPECRVPVVVSREYDLPAWVGPGTLVIASSYSGNTEETLSAFEQAHARGARLLAVTTGGKLAGMARDWGTPALTFNYQSQPRAALGHSLVLLLGILGRLGFVADKGGDLDETVKVMQAWQAEIRADVPEATNPAKQLARRLHGRLPVVYGAGHLSEVAHRYKTQFNENSKHWAEFDVFSELNHNAVVGYEHPRVVIDRITVIMLVSDQYQPQIAARMRITGEILDQRKVDHVTVATRGESALAQVLSLIHFGDYVSFYLALLNEADPTPVKVIDYLKQRLAEL